VTERTFLAAWAFGAVLLQAPSALAADWTQKLPANSPPARSGPAMAYDAARGQVVSVRRCGSKWQLIGHMDMGWF
jgi:hypothetical protein